MKVSSEVFGVRKVENSQMDAHCTMHTNDIIAFRVRDLGEIEYAFEYPQTNSS